MSHRPASQADSSSACDTSLTQQQEAGSDASLIVAERAFPRSARLLTASDYSRVFKRNKRYSDQYWTILVRRDDSSPAQLGLAIAKKRAKRAVDRNKLKRIAREAFRHQKASLAGLQMVVMNRDAATHASCEKLRRSIDTLLQKMKTGVSGVDRNLVQTREPK